jgi:hypothetical protein
MDDRLNVELARGIAGAAQPPAVLGLGLHMATLLTWDPSTLTGSVDLDGDVLSDLPIESAIDAFSWLPGETVLVHSWHPPDGHRRRGFGSYWIRGRIFRPGAANAAKVLQALQNSFAKQIAAEIAAENIFSATALGTETRADTAGFGTLSGGPTLTVSVGNTGKVIVHLSTSIIGTEAAAEPGIARAGGRMSVSLSGANTAAGSSDRSVAILGQFASAPGTTDVIEVGGRFGTTFALDELNPGDTVFTAQYARLFPGTTCDFTDRTIVVQRA